MSSLSEMAEPGAGAGAEVTTVGGAETMVGVAVEAATAAEVITPPSGTPASEVTPPGEGGSAPARGPWASTRSMMYL